MRKLSLFELKAVLSVLLLLVILPGSSALAQVDVSGMWSPLVHEDAPQRGNGSLVGDFTGLPMSQANRLRSESWAADMMEVAEWVCRPYSSDDGLYAAPAQLYIWKEIDKTTQQVIAYHAHIFYHEQEQTIWMDGRPHPPDYALHTWAGFSTGEWEGNTLLFTTTHLKESFIERNGPVRSDRATVRSRFRRYGNYLIATVITYDPVYLTEPFIRTETWLYSPETPMRPYPCEEATETVVPRGKVPHYLPGKNPILTEFAAQYGIPPEAALGGAETMYPEYIALMKKMKTLPRPARKSTASSGEDDQ
jgi:hypothetical protein